MFVHSYVSNAPPPHLLDPCKGHISIFLLGEYANQQTHHHPTWFIKYHPVPPPCRSTKPLIYILHSTVWPQPVPAGIRETRKPHELHSTSISHTPWYILRSLTVSSLLASVVDSNIFLYIRL